MNRVFFTIVSEMISYCSYVIFLRRKWLFDAQPEDPDYNPLPEERPGGFDWGDGVAAGGQDQGQQGQQDQGQQGQGQ